MIKRQSAQACQAQSTLEWMRSSDMQTLTSQSLKVMDQESYRTQQTSFCILTLCVISMLLFLHTLFASLLGEPSKWIIVILGISFSLKVLEILWLQGRAEGITEKSARVETAISTAAMFALAGILAYLTNRDDAPYFVLLAIPILQCAYHFGLIATSLTISAAVGMIFFWMRHFFVVHPPAAPTEFMEAGMISIIYALMGTIVWFLVHQLKQEKLKVSESLIELELTRERLSIEEKLAAIGRLAGNIAHEIRNPVAMISSSLATAANPDLGDEDREEMLQIATREASRLEHLTSEFLNYARPSAPRRSPVLVSDLLSYIADVVKAHAANNQIDVVHSSDGNLAMQADSTQIQGALLNLVLNGIDAASSNGSIALEASKMGTFVRIDVQNSGIPISESDLPRIFEPFYSTKPAGTGLGLPIARRVAQAHGGDLWVSCNESGRVVFSMTIADAGSEDQQKE